MVFRVPRTLVTSHQASAREFIADIGVAAVASGAFLGVHTGWRETRLIESSDVDRLELVEYDPVIFQEYIKGVDLRIR